MTKKRLFERIIGAILVSAFCFILYSIFLDSETQNYIDRSTQIPGIPEFIEPLEIEEAQIEIVEPEKSVQEIFIPTQEVSSQQALESDALERELLESQILEQQKEKNLAVEANVIEVSEGMPEELSQEAEVSSLKTTTEGASNAQGTGNNEINEDAAVNRQPAVPKAWVLQVGSFSGEEKADQIVDQLLSESYKAYKRFLGRDDLYRVLVGPYVDADQAVRHQRKVDSLLGVSTLLMKFES